MSETEASRQEITLGGARRAMRKIRKGGVRRVLIDGLVYIGDYLSHQARPHNLIVIEFAPNPWLEDGGSLFSFEQKECDLILQAANEAGDVDAHWNGAPYGTMSIRFHTENAWAREVAP